MKTSLLTILFLLTSITYSYSQADIEVILNEPIDNANLSSGTPFTFDLTVANIGTVDIPATDTILFAVVVNGAILPGAVYSDATGLDAGDSANYSLSVTLTGGTSGTLTICGTAVAVGPTWDGISESDSTNNLDCADVNWDAVGIEELSLAQAGDDSYYADGTYFVRLKNQPITSTAQLVVYSMTGAQVFSTSLNNGSYGVISQDVQLGSLPKGIYLVQIQGKDFNIQARKISVQ